MPSTILRTLCVESVDSSGPFSMLNRSYRSLDFIFHWYQSYKKSNTYIFLYIYICYYNIRNLWGKRYYKYLFLNERRFLSELNKNIFFFTSQKIHVFELNVWLGKDINVFLKIRGTWHMISISGKSYNILHAHAKKNCINLWT